MKTLFERLKPEFKIQMETSKVYYYEMITQVFTELRNSKNWIDLPYWVICDLVAFFELADYNPSTISNLFENE